MHLYFLWHRPCIKTAGTLSTSPPSPSRILPPVGLIFLPTSFFLLLFFSFFLPLLQPATSLFTPSLLVNSFVIYWFTKSWTFSNVSERPLSSQPSLTSCARLLHFHLTACWPQQTSSTTVAFSFLHLHSLQPYPVAYYRTLPIPFFSIPLSVSKPPCAQFPRTSTVQSGHLLLFSLVSSIVHLAATAANCKYAYALAATFSG